MKQTFVAATMLAVGATAQSSTSTRTVYYNTCTTSGGIVTATDIETYCPPCEAAGMTTFAGGSLTTYVTQYSQVCPTGLEEATYTVTEPCPSTGLARGSGYIPQGFTVSTVPCSVCEAGKSQYAQTTPGPALASALASPAAAPAVPTPAAEAESAAPPAAAAPAAAPVAPGAPAAPAAAPANAPNSAAAPGAAAPAENGAAAPAGSPANAPNAAAAPGAAAPAENGAAAPAGSPANSPNAAAAPGAAAPAENGAVAPAGSGAGSPANSPNAAAAPGAAAPAENGAAAPAGSATEAPAPYPLPSQAGQVATANGAPASSGNSTVPFTGAASQLSTVDISSFIAALTALITGFFFVL